MKLIVNLRRPFEASFTPLCLHFNGSRLTPRRSIKCCLRKKHETSKISLSHCVFFFDNRHKRRAQKTIAFYSIVTLK